MVATPAATAVAITATNQTTPTNIAIRAHPCAPPASPSEPNSAPRPMSTESTIGRRSEAAIPQTRARRTKPRIDKAVTSKQQRKRSIRQTAPAVEREQRGLYRRKDRHGAFQPRRPRDDRRGSVGQAPLNSLCAVSP